MIFDTVLPRECQENIPCKSVVGLIKLVLQKMVWPMPDLKETKEKLKYCYDTRF